jgi:hypothetical protein
MSDLWLALLPILLAMLISPARTIAVIMLLHIIFTSTKAAHKIPNNCATIILLKNQVYFRDLEPD